MGHVNFRVCRAFEDAVFQRRGVVQSLDRVLSLSAAQWAAVPPIIPGEGIA
jgi:hypothetical protein